MSKDRDSNLSWIEEELIGADLGDMRLDRRLVQVAHALAEHPSLPINHACSDWAATKAAYRFFENESIKADHILEPHIENTRQRISKYNHVVLVQDTSVIDFTKHYKTTGLGSIGGKTVFESLGLIMHTTLALTEKGLPLN